MPNDDIYLAHNEPDHVWMDQIEHEPRYGLAVVDDHWSPPNGEYPFFEYEDLDHDTLVQIIYVCATNAALNLVADEYSQHVEEVMASKWFKEIGFKTTKEYTGWLTKAITQLVGDMVFGAYRSRLVAIALDPLCDSIPVVKKEITKIVTEETKNKNEPLKNLLLVRINEFLRNNHANGPRFGPDPATQSPNENRVFIGDMKVAMEPTAKAMKKLQEAISKQMIETDKLAMQINNARAASAMKNQDMLEKLVLRKRHDQQVRNQMKRGR